MMENLNIPNIRKACELLDMPIEKFIENVDENIGKDEKFITLLNMLSLVETLNLEDEDIIQIFKEEDIND